MNINEFLKNETANLHLQVENYFESKQIFDKSENVLNQNEQEQFICLLTKVLKSSSKREQNKIFKGSDDLKEALYLHNDDARREKLKK